MRVTRVTPLLNVAEAPSSPAFNCDMRGFAVETVMYGLRGFHARDPDGYQLAITSPVREGAVGGSGGA